MNKSCVFVCVCADMCFHPVASPFHAFPTASTTANSYPGPTKYTSECSTLCVPLHISMRLQFFVAYTGAVLAALCATPRQSSRLSSWRMRCAACPRSDVATKVLALSLLWAFLNGWPVHPARPAPKNGLVLHGDRYKGLAAPRTATKQRITKTAL